ncbi:MAG: recombinase family protein [Actinobacteria bacterium]|nr:recombinase family protein [Actinomycetota bacterium]
MRVVGYAREAAGSDTPRPVFAQHEEIRRWAADHGHDLVAVCQDRPGASHPLERDGYLSLLGTVASGGVDAVALPGVATLSDDLIVQEILLWDLRSRGVRVLSTEAADAAVVGDEEPDAMRLVIRDVLARVEEHAATLARRPVGGRPTGGAEVVVELLASLPRAPRGVDAERAPAGD